MAVLLIDTQLRRGEPRTRQDLVHSVLEFDCVVQVLHSGQSQLTRHPVETGEQLADHSVPQPPEVRLAGAIVTDFPLELPGEQTAIDAANAGVSLDALTRSVRQLADSAPSSLVSSAQQALAVEPLAVRAYQQLEQWRVEGRPLELVEDFRSYENMVIQSVSVPRDAARGRSMVADIHLVHVDVAATRLVDAPVTERAASRKDKGPRAKKPATEGEQQRGRSFAHNATTYLRGRLGL